jgi:hypothetical protein
VAKKKPRRKPSVDPELAALRARTDRIIKQSAETVRQSRQINAELMRAERERKRYS